jgi:hypothetical protein
VTDKSRPSELRLLDPSITFDEGAVEVEAIALGQTTADFWAALKKAARQEADRLADQA